MDQRSTTPLHQSTRTWAIPRRGAHGVDVVTTALVIRQFGAGVSMRFNAQVMPSVARPRGLQARGRVERREL